MRHGNKQDILTRRCDGDYSPTERDTSYLQPYAHPAPLEHYLISTPQTTPRKVYDISGIYSGFNVSFHWHNNVEPMLILRECATWVQSDANYCFFTQCGRTIIFIHCYHPGTVDNGEQQSDKVLHRSLLWQHRRGDRVNACITTAALSLPFDIPHVWGLPERCLCISCTVPSVKNVSGLLEIATPVGGSVANSFHTLIPPSLQPTHVLSFLAPPKLKLRCSKVKLSQKTSLRHLALHIASWVTVARRLVIIPLQGHANC